MMEDQFLERYTTESLKIMARRRGMPQATTASKPALISFLRPRLFSLEANQRLVQALPPRQRQILSALKTRGNEANTVALAASVEGDHHDVDADIRRLVELGLLLYPREEHGRLYRLGECGRVWMDRTAAEAVEPLAVAGPSPKLLADPPAKVREASLGLLLADLFVFLEHLERHPCSPAAAAGDTNAWPALAAALLVPTPSPPGPGLAGSGRLLFLYHLLEEAELLKVRGGRLGPAESAAAFFHLEPADQARQALAAWLHLSDWNEFERITELIHRPSPGRQQQSDVPGSGRVMQARRLTLRALKRFEPGRWYAFSALLREIKQSHAGFLLARRDATHSGGQYAGFGERGRGDTSRALDLITDWDRVEGRFVARLLLEPLHWLGAVSLGFDSTAEEQGSHLDAFRLTDAGALLLGLSKLLPHSPQENGTLVVQPDFTMMLLSSFPDTGLLHDLSRFAAYTGGDRVIRFSLNRQAAQRGFRAGWTSERILERLQAAAGQAVPRSLASRLQDWERSYNRFRIVRHVTLLEDADGLLTAGPDAEEMAACLGDPVAPALFRPDVAALPRLLRQMKQKKIPLLRFDHARVGHGLGLGPGLRIRQHARGNDWVTTALLDRVAVRQEDDPALWTLDRLRVKATLKAGTSTAHLREQLERRSPEASPEIRLALRTWSSDGHPVSLARASLFTCEDRHTLRLILDTPSLAACLGERLAPDTFTVKGGLRPFRQALSRLGVQISAQPGQRHHPPRYQDGPQTETADDGTLPFHWERRDGVRGMAATARSEEQLRFLLNRAIEKRRKLSLDYFDAGKRQTVTREVSPLLLEDSSLAAFSHQSRSEESFLLARILAVRFLPERY